MSSHEPTPEGFGEPQGGAPMDEAELDPGSGLRGTG